MGDDPDHGMLTPAHPRHPSWNLLWSSDHCRVWLRIDSPQVLSSFGITPGHSLFEPGLVDDKYDRRFRFVLDHLSLTGARLSTIAFANVHHVDPVIDSFFDV